MSDIISQPIIEVTTKTVLDAEEIVLKVDNFDAVAEFLGAGIYTVVRSKIFNTDKMEYDPDYVTTGGFFSINGKEPYNLKIGQTIIRPILNFRDVTFIEPVDE